MIRSVTVANWLLAQLSPESVLIRRNANQQDRRVRVTAAQVRLLVRLAEHQRATLRWQHPLKRETPNWHRANNAQSRVRMEGWRQIGGWLAKQRDAAEGTW